MYSRMSSFRVLHYDMLCLIIINSALMCKQDFTVVAGRGGANYDNFMHSLVV